MTQNTKDDFKKGVKKDQVYTLTQEGSEKTHGPPYSNKIGIYWHRILSAKLQEKEIEKEEDYELAGELITRLKTQFNITLLEADFPLYGYVYEKAKKRPIIFLWKNLKADAIGWDHQNKKYVVVEYKLSNDVETFWRSAETYGYFLHQCLVYARLLQLHMNLADLPRILLVPISNRNGRDILPGLFHKYREECKAALEKYCWSKVLPTPPQKIRAQWPFRSNLAVGCVEEEMSLNDLFDENATVKDLTEAFAMNSLEVC